jgi:hypothetical protein
VGHLLPHYLHLTHPLHEQEHIKKVKTWKTNGESGVRHKEGVPAKEMAGTESLFSSSFKAQRLRTALPMWPNSVGLLNSPFCLRMRNNHVPEMLCFKDQIVMIPRCSDKNFLVPRGSVPSSYGLATGPYPDSNDFSPHCSTLFLYSSPQTFSIPCFIK